MGCSLRRPPVSLGWGAREGRTGTLRLFQTLSLLNAVAGCQKELALFPAPKGRAEEMLDLCVSFFQGVGKQKGARAISGHKRNTKGRICRRERTFMERLLKMHRLANALREVARDSRRAVFENYAPKAAQRFDVTDRKSVV